MSLQQELAELFRRDLTRLTQELEAFPGDAYLWKTVPGITNAAGNLALHVEGNLRDYIGRHLGGVAFTRDRHFEFNTQGLPASGLIARIGALQPLIPDIIQKLSDAQLNAPFPEPMWGAPRITRQLLLHVYGHLNYHLGQIGYLRRMLTAGAAVRFVQLPNQHD
jgi:uncharacterized damage-inducible protein DinB